MFVACSTLCFARHPLEEALRVIREMNFPKADLAIHAPGPHLRPADLTADLGKVAQKLRAANLGYAAFHMDFGDASEADQMAELRAACRLGRLLAVPMVTVAAAPHGADLTDEATRLSEWVKVAAGEGVILTVETRAGTVTGDPEGAAQLCEQVPGLGLTLDPSHYLIRPQGPADFDSLFRFVRHVRLRDSGMKPDQFQLRVGQGDVEYGRVITGLERFRYERALTVDIRDVPDNAFPIEPEVRKLKYLLESLI